MNIKRFVSSIVMVMFLLGSLQLVFADASPVGHDSSQIHAMEMHLVDDQVGDVDCCHDDIGCDLEGLCGGHLCSAIQSMISVDMSIKEQFVLSYVYNIGSFQIRLKDRPPQLLIS